MTATAAPVHSPVKLPSLRQWCRERGLPLESLRRAAYAGRLPGLTRFAEHGRVYVVDEVALLDYLAKVAAPIAPTRDGGE